MINCVSIFVRYFGLFFVYSFLELGYVKFVIILDVKLGKEIEMIEILLFSGKFLICWKVKNGLLEVYMWFDE